MKSNSDVQMEQPVRGRWLAGAAVVLDRVMAELVAEHDTCTTTAATTTTADAASTTTTTADPNIMIRCT